MLTFNQNQLYQTLIFVVTKKKKLNFRHPGTKHILSECLFDGGIM